MIHELKTWSEYFNDIVSGKKPFELRKNDRNFQVGDKLHLIEIAYPEPLYLDGVMGIDPVRLSTGRSITKEVTYILHGPLFGLEEGYCVMGLK